MSKRNNTIAVIGGGFSSLSAASYLSKAGHEVHLFEQHDQLGGRARQFKAEGFTFDMGPSWYWMPDVFEKYYADFGYTVSDFYDLKLLDPGFRMIFKNKHHLNIPYGDDALCKLFEQVESGAGAKLERFLKDGAYKYDVGINDLVYKPGLHLSELIDARILSGLFKLDLLKPFDKYVRSFFKDSRLVRLMEFPILFLGAAPSKTPALYSLMNYAGLSLGTWYPMGGMHEIVKAFAKIAEKVGVHIHLNTRVQRIHPNGSSAKGLIIDGVERKFDFIVGGADYHHVDQKLLSESHSNYSKDYWDKRTMAPSSLLYYLGINKRLTGLEHHNLFFDADLDIHAHEIYNQPKWPSDPLFYVCNPSKTDSSVAPSGMENIFILIPTASGLNENEAVIDKYFDIVIDRMEGYLGQSIRDSIIYRRNYGASNFIADYNSFKGNAYGLANTLMQTANLKPSIRNKKLKNLYYTGHLTVPGPGVPPSIISGKVVADQILKSTGHEMLI